MFGLIFWILMFVVFGKICWFAMKAAWGVSKIVCSVILLPLFYSTPHKSSDTPFSSSPLSMLLWRFYIHRALYKYQVTCKSLFGFRIHNVCKTRHSYHEPLY